MSEDSITCDGAPGEPGGGQPRRRAAQVSARLAVAEACRPCPERDGPLRRDLLCRCPVALGLRLLQDAETAPCAPAGWAPGERALLDFQARALPDVSPPLDWLAVERGAARLAQVHGPRASGDCRACLALEVLEAACEREASRSER